MSTNDATTESILNRLDKLEQANKIPDTSGDPGPQETRADWIRRVCPQGAYYDISHGLFFPGKGKDDSEISLTAILEFWEVALLLNKEDFMINDFGLVLDGADTISYFTSRDNMTTALPRKYYFIWNTK